MQDPPRTPDPDDTSRDIGTDPPRPGGEPVPAGPPSIDPDPAPADADAQPADERDGSVRAVPLRSTANARSIRQRGTAREQAWFWPVVSLAGLLAVIGVNVLATSLPLNGQTTGEISDAHPVFFRPAGWTFTIWGVIYALLLVVVIYGLLPVGQRDRRVQAIGPVFLVANIANIAWIFAWHWERFALSLIVMVVLLASLAIIYGLIRRHADERMSRLRRLVLKVPFAVYLGWISVAILANLQTWMDAGGWSGGLFGLRGWAVVFLFAGILVAAGVAIFAREAAYPLVFAWGYAGIAAEQWDASRLVSILAGVLSAVAVVVAGMAFMLAFDTRSGVRPLPNPLRRNRPMTDTVDG